MKIKITFKIFTINAELKNTDTAKKIYEALSLESNTNVWGEEIYFIFDVHIGLESDANEEVENGDLAYWPSCPAFCIFFGRTPVSKSDKPIAYSPVNVLEKLKGILMY